MQNLKKKILKNRNSEKSKHDAQWHKYSGTNYTLSTIWKCVASARPVQLIDFFNKVLNTKKLANNCSRKKRKGKRKK